MQVIVLDRDGVINEDSDDFIKSPEEWQPIPGSLEAIARLNQAGYRVVVATNQSGLGRRLFDIEILTNIHNKMHQHLAKVGGHIEAIFFCPHRPSENCECRKPRPGMFREIEERLHMPLAGVPCVGDSLRDLEAAQAVGGRPILVRTGKGERTLRDNPQLADVPVFADLSAVADALIAEIAEDA